jgi:hypothetical protein
VHLCVRACGYECLLCMCECVVCAQAFTRVLTVSVEWKCSCECVQVCEWVSVCKYGCGHKRVLCVSISVSVFVCVLWRLYVYTCESTWVCV